MVWLLLALAAPTLVWFLWLNRTGSYLWRWRGLAIWMAFALLATEAMMLALAPPRTPAWLAPVGGTLAGLSTFGWMRIMTRRATPSQPASRERDH